MNFISSIIIIDNKIIISINNRNIINSIHSFLIILILEIIEIKDSIK